MTQCARARHPNPAPSAARSAAPSAALSSSRQHPAPQPAPSSSPQLPAPSVHRGDPLPPGRVMNRTPTHPAAPSERQVPHALYAMRCVWCQGSDGRLAMSEVQPLARAAQRQGRVGSTRAVQELSVLLPSPARRMQVVRHVAAGLTPLVDRLGCGRTGDDRRCGVGRRARPGRCGRAGCAATRDDRREDVRAAGDAGTSAGIALRLSRGTALRLSRGIALRLSRGITLRIARCTARCESRHAGRRARAVGPGEGRTSARHANDAGATA